MRCQNCGNEDAFVLVAELTVMVRPPADCFGPDWGLLLECADCASTDVEGDAVSVLSARVG